jgi:hypothetical protein
MSLPFADRPEESSIYQDLKTVTLQDLTPEQFDALRGRMFSEGVNGLEDEYRRLQLLGEAAGVTSSSGILRNSIKIASATMVDNAVSYFNFGEGVYGIQQIIAVYTGGSGTLSFRSYYYDGGTSGAPALEWFFGGSTSSTLYTFNSDSQFDELANQAFGDGMQLGVKVNGTFTSGNYYVVYHRVR